ncbi:MAG: hypothetical protein GC129_01085 [Proteobacteria bacterium]|nr:hypothetical protein [Pseudomonadota bacterium]
MLRRIVLALLVLLLIPLGFVGKLYLNQDAIVFPRTINHVPPPSEEAAPFEHLTLTTADGTQLNGVFFPATAPSPTLVLAFGGNAHDVVGFAAFLKNTVFPGGSVAVAGFSYRGYPNAFGARSTGEPTETSLKGDAAFLYDTFNQRLHPAQVDAVGYSLGTAVATWLATQRPLNHLVLVAPPASIRRLAEEKYPWLPVRWLLKYPWATEDIIDHVSARTTILYAPTDGLIPSHHIEILASHLTSATVMPIPGTTHSTILDAPSIPAHLRTALDISMSTPLQP